MNKTIMDYYPIDWMNVFDASDSSVSLQDTVGSGRKVEEDNVVPSLSSAARMLVQNAY